MPVLMPAVLGQHNAGKNTSQNVKGSFGWKGEQPESRTMHLVQHVVSHNMLSDIIGSITVCPGMSMEALAVLKTLGYNGWSDGLSSSTLFLFAPWKITTYTQVRFWLVSSIKTKLFNRSGIKWSQSADFSCGIGFEMLGFLFSPAFWILEKYSGFNTGAKTKLKRSGFLPCLKTFLISVHYFHSSMESVYLCIKVYTSFVQSLSLTTWRLVTIQRVRTDGFLIERQHSATCSALPCWPLSTPQGE